MSIEGLDKVTTTADELGSLILLRLGSLFSIQAGTMSPEDRVKKAYKFISAMKAFGEKLRNAVDGAESRLEQFAGKHGVRIPDDGSSPG